MERRKSECNHRSALLTSVQLEVADLTACRAFGISAWNLNLGNAIQKDIVITPESEPAIQVDRLDLAQFIYLLLNNT